MNVLSYVGEVGGRAAEAQQVQRQTGSFVASDGYLSSVKKDSEKTSGDRGSGALATAFGYVFDGK